MPPRGVDGRSPARRGTRRTRATRRSARCARPPGSGHARTARRGVTAPRTDPPGAAKRPAELAEPLQLDAEDAEPTPVALAAKQFLMHEGGHRPAGPGAGEAVAQPGGLVVRGARGAANSLSEPQQPADPCHELARLERLAERVHPMPPLEHLQAELGVGRVEQVEEWHHSLRQCLKPPGDGDRGERRGVRRHEHHLGPEQGPQGNGRLGIPQADGVQPGRSERLPHLGARRLGLVDHRHPGRVWVVQGHNRFSRDASPGARLKFRLRLARTGATEGSRQRSCHRAVPRAPPHRPGAGRSPRRRG